MRDAAATPRTRALSAALRQARLGANLGVRELARKLGLSHTTISQWETGKRVPSTVDVAAALAAIGVTGQRRTEISNGRRWPCQDCYRRPATLERSSA